MVSGREVSSSLGATSSRTPAISSFTSSLCRRPSWVEANFLAVFCGGQGRTWSVEQGEGGAVPHKFNALAVSLIHYINTQVALQKPDSLVAAFHPPTLTNTHTHTHIHTLESFLSLCYTCIHIFYQLSHKHIKKHYFTVQQWQVTQ